MIDNALPDLTIVEANGYIFKKDIHMSQRHSSSIGFLNGPTPSATVNIVGWRSSTSEIISILRIQLPGSYQ